MKTANFIVRMSIVLTVMFAPAVFSSCGGSSTKQETEQEKLPAGVYYTCSMHPKVHEDKPGKCPICGMELVRSDQVHYENQMSDSVGDTTKMTNQHMH